MSIRSDKHVRIRTAELAAWLERQGSTWTVDGDPLLMGEVSFPCSGRELANALRKIGKALLLRSDAGNAPILVAEVDAAGLDSVVERDDSGNRVLELSWEGAPEEVDWLLIEDRSTPAAVSLDTAASMRSE